MTRRVVMVSVAVAVVWAGLLGAVLRLGPPRLRDPARGVAAGGAPDAAKTLGYLEQWARRDRWDRFPESPSFAFYNLYATRALGGAISPELRAQVIDYLRRCQASDGGFTVAPATGDSHVVPTLYAMRTLALLGALDAVDRPRAVAFLASLAGKDGGFRGRVAEADASLGTTFHALAALEILGALDRVDRPRTAAFVSSHRAAEGGFSLRPGMIPSPAATHMAVRSLKLVGALDPETAAGVARHLAASRYSGRFREGKFTSLPEIEEEAYVLGALAEVGRLDVVDGTEVERFVTTLYVAENGGFGPQPGLGTTPPSTYHAIACLVALGRLPVPTGG
ncbi:prenyltransferase/squalene oxidase repeat-containing protein [Anaeromyxobacter terrae]|uniref:prenyltransferase/squalene oxidase repeat-containing protein n=1 Tax=Anaeromyxobacter terrae TaxID=2925406 RepID=UPI001F56884E|nr:prenyltransferase/squalene oxidase repeat-containing protein [Anaeromyxobacter sp. SG22]